MRAPAVSLPAFALGLARHGFIRTVGDAWRARGDLFEVRTGGKPLMFALHPDAVVHITHTHRDSYDKVASYDGVRRYVTGDGIVTSTGALWRRQRKLMAPLFTPKAAHAYADLMLADAQRLGDRWDGLADADAPVDMPEEMALVTARIILQAMFGTDVDLPIDRVREAVDVMVGFANTSIFGPVVPLWVPTRRNRRYRELSAFAYGAIDGIIADRRAADPSTWPDDLLTRLMHARDDETGEAMSERLLRDEALTIFFAGHETTARSMTFAWYALAANPDVAARLHDELDRELGGAPPTIDALHRLPYTLQVVKEVLRLYPAAPMYVRDAVGPDTLAGFDVRPGTAVLMSSYHTHRHPEFWPDPERFDPDRWTPEREAAIHRGAYHPFASGPRICLGNHFSMLETHLLLAVLAQRFAPALPDGYAPAWEIRGLLGLDNGLPMRLVRRDRTRQAA